MSDDAPDKLDGKYHNDLAECIKQIICKIDNIEFQTEFLDYIFTKYVQSRIDQSRPDLFTLGRRNNGEGELDLTFRVYDDDLDPIWEIEIGSLSEIIIASPGTKEDPVYLDKTIESIVKSVDILRAERVKRFGEYDKPN